MKMTSPSQKTLRSAFIDADLSRRTFDPTEPTSSNSLFQSINTSGMGRATPGMSGDHFVMGEMEPYQMRASMSSQDQLSVTNIIFMHWFVG